MDCMYMIYINHPFMYVFKFKFCDVGSDGRLLGWTLDIYVGIGTIFYLYMVTPHYH